MTPDERQLIEDLFERMRAHGLPEKDRQAEALIAQSVRASPDAAYMLVQSVLVQEQALQAANDRVLELEEQVRRLEEGDKPRARSGGFLGSVWGNSSRRDEEPRSSSVPVIGSRASRPAYADRAQAWSPGAGGQPQPAQQQAAGGGGGSFMRTALGTAAGVAGGMLLADSIRNMMGGGAHASPSRDAEAQRAQDARDDAAEDAREQREQDARDDAIEDARDEGGYDDGGFDSGDIEA